MYRFITASPRFTNSYKPYEEVGMVNSIVEKAQLRYPDNNFVLCLKEFLFTYRSFIDYEKLYRFIEEIEQIQNDIHTYEYKIELLLGSIRDELISEIPKQSINQKVQDEQHINNNYLLLNQFFYAQKDCALLFVKYRHYILDYNTFYQETRLLNSIENIIQVLLDTYKLHKERVYLQQNLSLLHSKIPKDVCNYVIQPFL